MKKIKKILFLFLFTFSINNASDSLWTTVSYMPISVTGAAAVTFEDKIYIFGGYSDSLYSSMDIIQVFDPNTLEWSVEANMLSPRANLYAASNKDGIFYGGGESDSIQIGTYNDFSLEFYSPLNSIQNTPFVYDENIIFLRDFTSAEIFNNELFLIGGYSFSDFNLIIKYDITSKTVIDSFLAFNPNNSVSFGIMTALLNNNIYLIGGIETYISSNISSIDLDFKNPVYKYSSLIKPRAYGKAVAVESTNQIYVIGGFNELEDALSSVEILTFSENGVSVTKGPELNIGRTDFMAVEYDNKIYVFGGIDEDYFNIPTVEMLEIKPNSVEMISQDIPEQFSLKQNYPNPFNPTTTIEYTLPFNEQINQFVTLKVYDILGKEIATLVNQEQTSGTYSVKFNATNLSSGVYYYSIFWNGHSLTNKMILTK